MKERREKRREDKVERGIPRKDLKRRITGTAEHCIRRTMHKP